MLMTAMKFAGKTDEVLRPRLTLFIIWLQHTPQFRSN